VLGGSESVRVCVFHSNSFGIEEFHSQNAAPSRVGVRTHTCGAQTSRGARSKLSGTVAKWWFAIREARSLTHPPAL